MIIIYELYHNILVAPVYPKLEFEIGPKEKMEVIRQHVY